MSAEEALEAGESPADVGNGLIGDAVKTRAGAIAKLAAQCDLDLALYLDPEDERWGWHEDTPTVMVECVVALQEAVDALAETLKNAHTVAFDALKHGNVDAVWLDGGRRGFRPKQTKRRKYPDDKKRDLVSRAKREIVQAVAVNPLTGEPEEARALVAREALNELARWQTINARYFKSAPLTEAGIDLDEYTEWEWANRIEEVRG